MRTYIEIILLEYIFSIIFTREFLLCAHGRAGQTQLPFWRRISQSEIRNSAAAEKNWNRKARAGKMKGEAVNVNNFKFLRSLAPLRVSLDFGGKF